MEKQSVLKKLQNDKHYYGEFGRKYLSASNVRSLLYEPTRYGQFEKTLPLIQGGYFHTLMLEPENLKSIMYLTVKPETTKSLMDTKLRTTYISMIFYCRMRSKRLTDGQIR